MRHVRPDIANDSVLRWLTAEVIAYRITRPRRLDMDRVTEKLKQAAGVVARSNDSLEKEADKLIAREADFEKRKTEAFAPHYALLDSRNREMDQLEDALKIVSNADPLAISEPGSPAVEQGTFPDKTL
jgi:hypothetical protein